MAKYMYKGKLKIFDVFEETYLMVADYNLLKQIIADLTFEEYYWSCGSGKAQIKSLRYATDTKPIQSLDNIMLKIEQVLAGTLEVQYAPHYSELTGYLWTDEKLTVGGHDILNELNGYEGKYLYLEIETMEEE